MFDSIQNIFNAVMEGSPYLHGAIGALIGYFIGANIIKNILRLKSTIIRCKNSELESILKKMYKL